MIRDTYKLVVVGDAGSGKTTFIHTIIACNVIGSARVDDSGTHVSVTMDPGLQRRTLHFNIVEAHEDDVDSTLKGADGVFMLACTGSKALNKKCWDRWRPKIQRAGCNIIVRVQTKKDRITSFPGVMAVNTNPESVIRPLRVMACGASGCLFARFVPKE
jgi:septin family protein